MRAIFQQICFVSLILCGLGPVAHAELTVTTHHGNGGLVAGFNLLVGGDEFLLPAAGVGTRYLVANDTGQAVKIIPNQGTLAIGTLPPGHQGLLGVSGKLDLLEIGTAGYYLWQGGLADGGDYYPPAVANISLAPSALAFGSVTAGTAADLTLTITNAGGADLVLGSLASVDTLAAPFSLTAGSDGCSNQTLAPAAGCTAAVRFAPEAVGPFSDSFDVPSNDPGTPVLTVSVSGAGVVAATIIGTDFSEYGLGSGVPAGWTERWETGTATYTVLDSLEFPGHKELHAYSSTGARRLISFDSADGLGPDVEQLMLFNDPVNEGSIHTDFRLYARANSGASDQNAYYLTIGNNQKAASIYKTVNGVLTPMVGEKQKIAINSTDSWWFRFRVEGTSLMAKVWSYGSVEPRDWQLTAIDNSITAGGWQGIGNYWIGDHIFHEYSAAAIPESAVPVTGFGIVALPANVVNLDAESGDTRGWTNEFGELRINLNTTLARSGTAHFIGGGADYRAYQRIDLAQNGVGQSHLDQGVVISFRAWQRSLSYDDDPGRIGIRILDKNGNELSISFTDWDGKNSTYMPKSLVQTLPADAAFVDLILEGKLLKGVSASAYFDDLEVGIAVK
jgi:hypothetical protein